MKDLAIIFAVCICLGMGINCFFNHMKNEGKIELVLPEIEVRP